MLNFHSHLKFTAYMNTGHISAVINTIKTKNNYFKALGTNSAAHCSSISRLVKNDSKD